MLRALWWLPFAAMAIGCAEEELVRVPTRVESAVVLTNREPCDSCVALDSVEVQSGRDDQSTSDALRDAALARGANYVVLDAFAVLDDDDERVLARARFFVCPEPQVSILR
jgi:hypothetical protein